MLQHLCVLVDDSAATLLPCGKQDAAVAALVVDVLQAVNQIGYAADTKTCAEDEGPDTVQRVSQTTHEAGVVVVGRTGWYCRRCIQPLSRLSGDKQGSRREQQPHPSCAEVLLAGIATAESVSLAWASAAGPLAAAASGLPAGQQCSILASRWWPWLVVGLVVLGM